jgi:transposase
MVEAIEHPLPKKIFFQDESRFGLMTQTGRMWARKGQRPGIPYRMTREYLALFSSVCPSTGEMSSLISPYMNTHAMNAHLQILSEEHPDTCNVVVLDGAGWHRSRELQIPDNVKLIRLPPYSPQLNPIEQIWLYLKSHFTRGAYFENLDQVQNRLLTGVRLLHARPDIVKSVAKLNYAQSIFS